VVVSRYTHRPGHGFIAWDINDLEEGYRQVYSLQWLELANPFGFAEGDITPEELAHRLVAKPEEAAEVYARIRNRGFAQVVFRLALLAAYRQRCAFCGLSLRVALQAAHIIPWSHASPAERVLPSNGLLLCSTHHALFDSKILTVATDLRIRCRQSELPGHQWNDEDRRAAVALDGRLIVLPADVRHRPSKAALAYRASVLQD
jgi:putative restriction endonuclease